jgi:hypothetical protein
MTRSRPPQAVERLRDVRFVMKGGRIYKHSIDAKDA